MAYLTKISMSTGFKKDSYYFLLEQCFQTYVKEACGPPSTDA